MKDKAISRRATPRIVPPGTLEGFLEGSSKRLVICDISLGGMAIIADTPLPRNSMHVVKLTYRGVEVTTHMKAIHARRCPTGWIVGCSFVPSPTDRGPSVGDLLEDLTGSLISFD